jgi:hypothetical protein
MNTVNTNKEPCTRWKIISQHKICTLGSTRRESESKTGNLVFGDDRNWQFLTMATTKSHFRETAAVMPKEIIMTNEKKCKRTNV